MKELTGVEVSGIWLLMAVSAIYIREHEISQRWTIYKWVYFKSRFKSKASRQDQCFPLSFSYSPLSRWQSPSLVLASPMALYFHEKKKKKKTLGFSCTQGRVVGSFPPLLGECTQMLGKRLSPTNSSPLPLSTLLRPPAQPFSVFLSPPTRPLQIPS